MWIAMTFTKTLIIFPITMLFFFCITSYSWYMIAIPYLIYLKIPIITLGEGNGNPLQFRCIYEVISSGINSHFWHWYSSYVLQLFSVNLFSFKIALQGMFFILRCWGLSGQCGVCLLLFLGLDLLVCCAALRLVTQLCPALCGPVDYRLLGSPVRWAVAR